MAALTFALVFASPNRLIYQMTTDGSATAGTLTTTGAASPDILTDIQTVAPGPIAKCALAFTNGFGALAAGAKTQAQARAIWLSISPAANINGTLATAQCRATPQTAATVFAIDANVDGGGHPTIVATPSAVAGVGLLEIAVHGPIGE